MIQIGLYLSHRDINLLNKKKTLGQILPNIRFFAFLSELKV